MSVLRYWRNGLIFKCKDIGGDEAEWFQIAKTDEKMTRYIKNSEGKVEKVTRELRIFGCFSPQGTFEVEVGNDTHKLLIVRTWAPQRPQEDALKEAKAKDAIAVWTDHKEADFPAYDLEAGRPFDYDQEVMVHEHFASGSNGSASGSSSSSSSQKNKENYTLAKWDGKRDSFRGFHVTFESFLGKANKRCYLDPTVVLTPEQDVDFWDTLVLSFTGGEAFSTLLNYEKGKGADAWRKFVAANDPNARLCSTSDAVQALSAEGFNGSDLKSDQKFTAYLNRKTQLTKQVINAKLDWVTHGSMCKVFCLGPAFSSVFSKITDLKNTEEVDKALRDHRDIVLKTNANSGTADKSLLTQIADLKKQVHTLEKKNDLVLSTKGAFQGPGKGKGKGGKTPNMGFCFKCGTKGHSGLDCRADKARQRFYAKLCTEAGKRPSDFGPISPADLQKYKEEGKSLYVLDTGGGDQSSGSGQLAAMMGLETVDG